MKSFVLKLDYLTGRSVATAYNDRDRAEWPPHPARVYSALVAAWAESDEQDADERRALEWLATLDAPVIHAPEASYRQVVPHFVPVNDVSVLDAFERQRMKLDELREGLQQAKSEFESSQESGDKKALAKAKKSLAKAEKSLGVHNERLKSLLLADQQPFASGKHPGSGLQSARAMLPEHRGKQPRNFPSVSLEEPRVFFRWSASEAEVEQYVRPLADLAKRVVRVGHSASLVCCTVVDDCPTPNWEPNEKGAEVFRIPVEGQLALLEDAFALHWGTEPRVLPCRFVRYGRVGPGSSRTGAQSCFDDEWLVFRQMGGRRLSLTCAVELARAMRGALMKYADDPPPEVLSGHTREGEISQKTHLAIVPLPFVGHRHATGDLLGVAIVFPRDSDRTEREAVLRAVGRWEEKQRIETDDELVDTPLLQLVLGRAGAVELERVEWGVSPLKTLRSKTWCEHAREWVTATPIALDRNPGQLNARDPDKARAAYGSAEHSIKMACERIGLPTPNYVQVHPSVPLNGTVKARAFPPFPEDKSKHQRVKVHARIEFPQPVAGPVLLGAGRYFGLGLCLPLFQEVNRSE